MVKSANFLHLWYNANRRRWMEMLTQEQLEELCSSDPQAGAPLTEEELDAWYSDVIAESYRLDDRNSYAKL